MFVQLWGKEFLKVITLNLKMKDIHSVKISFDLVNSSIETEEIDIPFSHFLGIDPRVVPTNI